MSTSSSSNSNNKKKKKNEFLKSIFFKANAIAVAGCGCGSPKLCDAIEPIPIPKTSFSTLQNHNHQLLPSSSSSCDNNRNGRRSLSMDDGDYTCSTTTVDDDDDRGLVFKDSIAVVKDSEDPFEDFKRSMKQMIVEKRICSDEDLKALLNCFLELNSPFHHDVILRAFTHISNQIIVSAGRPSISQDDDDHHEPSDHS